MGIYSWFLAILAHDNLHISTWKKAVEGLAGAATLYTIFAICLTCCLAGVTVFSFLGLVLDICFVGCMIAIAIMTRNGANSCSGSNVHSPLGSGNSHDNASGTSHNIGYNCTLNKVAFAVSIIGAFFFLVTALMQIALVRHHKKEKRYGPSPDNNYTSGYGKRKLWQRKPKHAGEKEAELGAAGAGAGVAAHRDIRPSHDTAYTGSTVAAPTNGHVKKETDPVHGDHAPHVGGYNPHTTGTTTTAQGIPTTGSAPAQGGIPSVHGGYYSAPVGSANPYGYDNTQTTSTNARNF